MQKGRVLSGNALKLIAALAMLLDHVGVILLPQVVILRIVGRLAFPIFSFMIAEGCRYTKNKRRYFATVFGMGALCQAVLFAYNRSLEMNVLITFSLSVILIYALAWTKEAIFAEQPHTGRILCGTVLCGALVCAVGVLGIYVDLDYGATGVLLPVFAAMLHPPKGMRAKEHSLWNDPRVHVLSLSVGMLLLALDDGGLQFFSFLALPLLLLYSGKRGKWRIKYFFYVFYPAHLLLLQVIAWVIC